MAKLEQYAKVAREANALVVLPVTVLSLAIFLSKLDVSNEITEELAKKLSVSAKNTQDVINYANFRIGTPVAGQLVSLSEMAAGRSPYHDLDNYVLVTPLETGDQFIQGTAISLSPDGFWSRLVRFGESAAGCGERFVIQLIAADETLSDDRLNAWPSNARVSLLATVIRDCPAAQ